MQAAASSEKNTGKSQRSSAHCRTDHRPPAKSLVLDNRQAWNAALTLHAVLSRRSLGQHLTLSLFVSCITPGNPSTRSSTRSSTSAVRTDLSYLRLTARGFNVPVPLSRPSKRQIFYGLDGVGCETFLVEARSPAIITTCTTEHKIHVRLFVKRIPIPTVIFTLTQCKRVGISHYVVLPVQFVTAVHTTNTAQSLKLGCNNLQW
jgi:hypothetical protein